MTEEPVPKPDHNVPAPDAVERRGKIQAIAVFAWLLAAPVYVESLQLVASDMTAGWGDFDAIVWALLPAGITLAGCGRLAFWGLLLGLAFLGNPRASRIVAALCVIRGSIALYRAIGSDLGSPIAVVLLVSGIGYMTAALALLGSSALPLYLERRRARRMQSAPAAAV